MMRFLSAYWDGLSVSSLGLDLDSEDAPLDFRIGQFAYGETSLIHDRPLAGAIENRRSDRAAPLGPVRDHKVTCQDRCDVIRCTSLPFNMLKLRISPVLSRR